MISLTLSVYITHFHRFWKGFTKVRITLYIVINIHSTLKKKEQSWIYILWYCAQKVNDSCIYCMKVTWRLSNRLFWEESWLQAIHVLLWLQDCTACSLAPGKSSNCHPQKWTNELKTSSPGYFFFSFFFTSLNFTI